MRNPFRSLRLLQRLRRPPARHDPREPGRHRRPDRVRPTGAERPGRQYRSAAYRPLCAGRIRDRQFTLVRRGLDAGEVAAFLHRIADDVTALRAELDRTRDENARIKQALRDWQSRFGPRVLR